MQVPGDSQFVQQAEQRPAVVVAQGGLQLDLLDGIAGLLSVAQNTLYGTLPQLSHQWLLQASMSYVSQMNMLLCQCVQGRDGCGHQRIESSSDNPHGCQSQQQSAQTKETERS